MNTFLFLKSECIVRIRPHTVIDKGDAPGPLSALAEEEEEEEMAMMTTNNKKGTFEHKSWKETISEAFGGSFNKHKYAFALDLDTYVEKYSAISWACPFRLLSRQCFLSPFSFPSIIIKNFLRVNILYCFVIFCFMLSYITLITFLYLCASGAFESKEYPIGRRKNLSVVVVSFTTNCTSYIGMWG